MKKIIFDLSHRPPSEADIQELKEFYRKKKNLLLVATLLSFAVGVGAMFAWLTGSKTGVRGDFVYVMIFSFLTSLVCYVRQSVNSFRLDDCKPIDRNYCERMLDFCKANDRTNAYYKSVLAQGREFVTKEYSLFSSEVIESQLKQARLDLYGEKLLEKSHTPLAAHEGDKEINSIRHVLTLVFFGFKPDIDDAPVTEEYYEKAKKILGYVSKFFAYAALSTFFYPFLVAIMGSNSFLQQDPYFVMAFKTCVIACLPSMALAIFFICKSEDFYALGDTSIREFLGFANATPETKRYREQVLAQGREFIYAEFNAIKRKIQEESAKEKCKELYGVGDASV